MSFEGIIGNKDILNRLSRSINQERIFQSYIFEGPSGVGKSKVAFEMAKLIFCEKSNEISCDCCPSCLKMNGLNHPDFYEIKVLEKERIIRSSQIEQLIDEMKKKPYQAGKKIFVIESGHTLTEQSQNKLLKSIEDPLGDQILILLTDHKSKLLPTLYSRSIVEKFQPIHKELIESYLLKEEGFKSESVKLAASLCQGSLGMAKNMVQLESFYEVREKAFTFFKAIGEHSITVETIRILEELKKKSLESQYFLKFIKDFSRDALLIQFDSDTNQLYHMDKKTELMGISTLNQSPLFLQIIDEIEEIQGEMSYNVNVSFGLNEMIYSHI